MSALADRDNQALCALLPSPDVPCRPAAMALSIRTTECLVHGEVSGFSVSYAFDFRYAMEFVVTHMGTISSLDVSLRLP